MSKADAKPVLRRDPRLLVPFFLGASSISTLLLYFFGYTELRWAVLFVLLPAMAILLILALWAAAGHRELHQRIVGGIWAGALATTAYDVVRIPAVWSGVPVFKAISYFGTVILGVSSPTFWSEMTGWGYHLSNGIGFGLMYACLVRKPRWWTAVLWGTLLELAMLATPYAEVFGYRLAPGFIALTVGAHVVYGLALWLALRRWIGRGSFDRPASHRHALPAFLLGVALIAAAAVDFHRRHAENIPPSPPDYLGPHLYTTWNVLEPDRLAALWVLKRFSDPQARFHFVAPFSRIQHGKPFDIPEAEVRRGATLSATEVLVEELDLRKDARLRVLIRMAHLYEIARWMMPADREAAELGESLMAATGACDQRSIATCAHRAFEFLDRWHTESGR